MQEGHHRAPKSPPPFSIFVTEEEEAAAAAATLGFYGLSFSQLLTEDPPPMPQEVPPPPPRPWAAADLRGEGMLGFGRRQYMSSPPPHPQLPTMMHAPTMLRTFHYEAKPDSCAYLPPDYQSSLPQGLLNPFLQPTALIAGSPSPNYKLFHESNGAFEPVSDPNSDKTSQMSNLAVEKPPGDGYNWRKYGQKQVKGGEFPRSYYKCTAAKCDVKKQVERSSDGNIKEIIYKGEHNHQPSQNRRGEEGGYDDNDTESKFENSLVSTDDDEDGTAINEGDSKSGLKINRDTESVESTSQRTVMTTPRVVLQTISETDLLDDGYKWHKYGQKYVKGNNHPRSYYKCTNAGCNVRKRVERSKKDPKAVLTTYEDKHNHDLPKARSSNRNTVSAEPASLFYNSKYQLTRKNEIA